MPGTRAETLTMATGIERSTSRAWYVLFDDGWVMVGREETTVEKLGLLQASVEEGLTAEWKLDAWSHWCGSIGDCEVSGSGRTCVRRCLSQCESKESGSNNRARQRNHDEWRRKGVKREKWQSENAELDLYLYISSDIQIHNLRDTPSLSPSHDYYWLLTWWKILTPQGPNGKSSRNPRCGVAKQRMALHYC